MPNTDVKDRAFSAVVLDLALALISCEYMHQAQPQSMVTSGMFLTAINNRYRQTHQHECVSLCSLLQGETTVRPDFESTGDILLLVSQFSPNMG